MDFLIRALRAHDSARNRATLRLLSLSISENLADAEESEIANVLWSGSDPVLSGITGPNPLLDWIYSILPELEPHQAEQSFRRKWLSPNPSEQNERGTLSSEMLAQVGVAVAQPCSFGYHLELSCEEQGHIVNHNARLVESLVSGPVAFHLDFESTITGMCTLLAEVEIPKTAAEDLFDYAELIIGSHNELRPHWFQDLAHIRLAIAFGLIAGLARALPDRLERIVYWVRTGLASDDEYGSAARFQPSDSGLRNQSDIHDGDEVPTLRLLCARLAWTLAHGDFGDTATITEWLAIAENDPFPEVRNAVVPSEPEQDSDEYEPLRGRRGAGTDPAI